MRLPCYIGRGREEPSVRPPGSLGNRPTSLCSLESGSAQHAVAFAYVLTAPQLQGTIANCTHHGISLISFCLSVMLVVVHLNFRGSSLSVCAIRMASGGGIVLQKHRVREAKETAIFHRCFQEIGTIGNGRGLQGNIAELSSGATALEAFQASA